MPAVVSDDELMERVKNGDRTGFAQLFDRHSSSVYGYCLRTLGGNRAMADDILQEVWVRVADHAHRYEARGHFKAWLMTITRNETLSQIRKQLPLSEDEEGVAEEGVSNSDAERDFLRQFEARKVHNAIEALPDTQRHALMLSVVDGLSHEEIANELSTTVSAVGSLVFRARQELRKKLKKKDER